MINLLPPNIKESTSYAIRNRALLNWVAAFVVGLAGIGLIVAFGHYQLNSSIKATEQQIAQSKERLEEQDLKGVQTRTEEIDTSIKLALKVLEKKVLFSSMLLKIGGIMPDGTILQGLSLDEVEGGFTLQAKAKSHDAATQIQVNVTDPSNGVFSTADILNIDCAEVIEREGVEPLEYPCTVSIRALFADDNPFLFINQRKDTDE